MTIESNRTIGGVASILTLLGVFSLIPSFFHYIFPNSTPLSLISIAASGVFGGLALVGFILFLIAMYGFSKDYSERRIFSNLIYGIVITIIAVVVATVVIVAIVLFNFATLFPNFGSSTSSSQISSSFSKTFGLFTPIFSLVEVVWIAFVMRAFNLLSNKSNVPLFKTGAKVLLAGALVNIVIAIIFASVTVGSNVSLSINTLLALLTAGNLMQDVAWALLAMAYFRIKPPPPQTVPAQPPFQTAPPASATAVFGQVKYCRFCGAPNQADAVYCTRCGQKQ